MPYSGGRHSVITEHLGPGDSERARVLIFDIEVSSEGMFSPADESVWNELHELRKIKNSCFFEAFTESALEEFR
ncbi:MAG: TIGR04255 family protein [Myxococcales bacterium]|nr:TIGR04255 family protein [Myxococcales bacterium]